MLGGADQHGAAATEAVQGERVRFGAAGGEDDVRVVDAERRRHRVAAILDDPARDAAGGVDRSRVGGIGLECREQGVACFRPQQLGRVGIEVDAFRAGSGDIARVWDDDVAKVCQSCRKPMRRCL